MKYPYSEGKYKSKYQAGSSYKFSSVVSANSQGRFPANIILECICDEVIEGKVRASKNTGLTQTPARSWKNKSIAGINRVGYADKDGKEKAIIHTNPECPCYILDKMSGDRKGWSRQYHNPFNPYGGNALQKSKTKRSGYYAGFNDKGGASRFFYCAKASKAERNMGLEGFEEKEHQKYGSIRQNRGKGYPKSSKLKNNHPTVKPLKLMEYLVILTSMPNPDQIYLDPFLGSGTTAMACKKLGKNWIGIEKEAEYVKIAEARINSIPKPLL
jgi:hypothetical protein